MATSDTPISHRGSGKPSGLATKVGPFPLWVYMVVIIAAVYIYEKKKKAAATTPAAPSASGGTPGGYGSAANGAPGDLGTGVSGPQTMLEYALAANAGQATTNPQWEANAESVLVGQGYPYVQIQSALNQYLSGGVLSSIQQEIVNAAILAVGQPPSPPSTQAASTASPTVAAPPVVPPANQTLTNAGLIPAAGEINSSAYPQTTENGEGVTILGTMQGGGKYTGENVGGGAPVYALINGKWQQGFDANSLPAGTPLATLDTFAPLIGGYATEML
jgi:hypothetical protein